MDAGTGFMVGLAFGAGIGLGLSFVIVAALVVGSLIYRSIFDLTDGDSGEHNHSD